MNERMTLLRKTLQLTQAEMGARLGVTRAAISRIESGDRNLTERMIVDIIRNFNVNDHWLRTGEGEMFTKPKLVSLDAYAQRHKISDFETEVIKLYMSLDSKVREDFMSGLKSIVAEELSKDHYHTKASPLAARNEATLSVDEIKRMRNDLDDL